MLLFIGYGIKTVEIFEKIQYPQFFYQLLFMRIRRFLLSSPINDISHFPFIVVLVKQIKINNTFLDLNSQKTQNENQ